MDGCVIAEGHASHEGYVKVRAEGRMWLAHRLAWTRARGPIPDGMVVHHACEERACVNVEHLQLMGRFEHTSMHNLQHSRGEHAARTGHEFAPASAGYRADGSQIWRCRICRNEKDRARLAA